MINVNYFKANRTRHALSLKRVMQPSKMPSHSV